MPLPDAALASVAAQLGVRLGDEQISRLVDYLRLLHKWNRVFNLTALRDPASALTHHVLDCLAVVPPLRRHGATTLVDVGSGGGLPGLVLAIAMPALRVTCVDAVAKKAAFMTQAVAELALPNVRVVHARVESLQDSFGVVMARAFAALDEFTRLTRHLLQPEGVWVAMKGKRPDDEMAALSDDVRVFHVEPLSVPRLNADRCLVWMRPAP